MRQLVVLSGKGGTGKTTVTAALAHLMAKEQRLVLVDADVDAPNLGLVLRPRTGQERPFCGGKRASIASSRCTGCGRCADVCRFDAIAADDGVYAIDRTGCEGCATCFYQCPEAAIEMADVVSGVWFQSETRFGPLVHALLHPGAENSGKLVSTIRQQAILVATQQRADWILVDGSPGIGCPVIAAVTGADLALLVAEPTVSGVHDLERALGVTAHFRVPAAVCVNKSDINRRLAEEIARYCDERAIPMLAQIPYDEVVLEAMRGAMAVTEMPDNAVSREIGALWSALKAMQTAT